MMRGECVRSFTEMFRSKVSSAAPLSPGHVGRSILWKPDFEPWKDIDTVSRGGPAGSRGTGSWGLRFITWQGIKGSKESLKRPGRRHWSFELSRPLDLSWRFLHWYISPRLSPLENPSQFVFRYFKRSFMNHEELSYLWHFSLFLDSKSSGLPLSYGKINLRWNLN